MVKERFETDVVVVGAGHAGGACALSLRQLGYEGSIVLVGEEAVPPYERPSLSKSYLDGTDSQPKYLADVATWAKKGIDLRLGSSVIRIDTSEHVAELADGGSFRYRNLVVATGGRPKSPFQPHPRLRVLRTWADSKEIADLSRRSRSVIIVGGGVIGLEVGATLRGLGLDVTIVEAADRLMGRMAPLDVADWIEALHQGAGCRIVKNVLASSFSTTAEGIRLVLTSGEELTADFGVVGVGIEPNVELAEAASLPHDNGILVDEEYRVNGVSDVFAIGDVARVATRLARDESWAHAEMSARVSARSILGLPNELDHIPWFWTSQFGHQLQMAGVTQSASCVVARGPRRRLYLDHSGVLIGCAMLDAIKEFALAKRLIGERAAIDQARAGNEQLNLRSAVVERADAAI